MRSIERTPLYYLRVFRDNSILLALIFLAGCATIVSGAHQDVVITSSPNSADVSISRVVAGMDQVEYTGMTPATVPLERKFEYVLSVMMDGYEPATVILENGLNGWIWGNLLFGGPIGAIIDLASGSSKKLDPDIIHVDLVSVSSASAGSKPELYAVFNIKNIDGELVSSSVKMVLDTSSPSR
jgi:hypothetical protein